MALQYIAKDVSHFEYLHSEMHFVEMNDNVEMNHNVLCFNAVFDQEE